MKFLVDNVTAEVHGGYDDTTINGKPLSGYYLVDVPWNDFYYDPNPFNNVTNLVGQKLTRSIAEASSILAAPSYVYNEFIQDSGIPVDTTLSTFYSLGSNKRFQIRPGGTIYLNDISYNFTSPPVSLYLTYNMYRFYQLPGAPSFGSYNYFVDTNNNVSDLSFSIYDTVPVPVLQFSLSYGLNSYAGGFSGPFNLQIVNNSLTNTYVLSDFYLYWVY